MHSTTTPLLSDPDNLQEQGRRMYSCVGQILHIVGGQIQPPLFQGSIVIVINFILLSQSRPHFLIARLIPTMGNNKKNNNLQAISKQPSNIKLGDDSPTPPTPPAVDIKSKEFSTETFKRLGMGSGITTYWQPATTAAFEINPEYPPVFEGIQNERIHETFFCRSQLTKTFVENHMAVGAARAYAQFVSADLHCKTTGSAECKAHEFIKYRSEADTIVKAKISLQRQNLLPKEDFKRAIEAALVQPTLDDRSSRLEVVFSKFGYFWPENLCLDRIFPGGKTTSWSKSADTASNSSRKGGQDVGGEFSLKQDLLGKFGGRIGANRERETSTSTDELAKAAVAAKTGGNIELESPAWERSVNDPNNWAIIRRDGVVPIWTLLDDELNKRVQDVIDDIFRLGLVSIESLYTIKHVHTKYFLNPRKWYYDENGAGRVVVAAPVLSGPTESSENTKWKFVPVRPGTGDMQKYLRYDTDNSHNYYIQPCGPKEKDMYLHASFTRDPPVTKKLKGENQKLDGQVSVRKITPGQNLPESDRWFIKRNNIPSDDNDDGQNIDLLMRKTDYVQKKDEFRLCCEAKNYLASHKVDMSSVKVKKAVRDGGESYKYEKRKLKDVEPFVCKFGEILMIPYQTPSETFHEMATWQLGM
ncbi:hypothetical protein BC938DRAFT_479865 [Jimgerdemannia flammicorona]|uniref:MACPF-like domain-containing protein n=1 Tax=Jimgerdemannia flammicorona TaxID=994334 RepID=A0A433QJY0_9FUNG|nr:hypothetical protein BC938DRAFT_479865 [Jimgerdemannia flammicorona]